MFTGASLPLHQLVRLLKCHPGFIRHVQYGVQAGELCPERRVVRPEVTEINGQKIIAVSRPGATKVFAIGTTGPETRIAIVQPAN